MSHSMMGLSNPLQEGLTNQLRKVTCLAILWKIYQTNAGNVEPELIQGFESFCQNWYEDQCNGRTGPIARLSHSQLLDIVVLLQNTTATHEDIKKEVAVQLPSL